MRGRFSTLAYVLALWFSVALLNAQVCPTSATSPKLICTIPQLYGPAGLVLGNPSPLHQQHFLASIHNNFTPLNSELSQELSILPFASPASAITFTFDSSLGVFTRSTETYGPILDERAETIGRHRFYLAADYQFFSFSSLDGIDLKHLPAEFTHLQFPVNGTFPLFEQDYLMTMNRIDIKSHQVTLSGTFGLTNRIDVSIAVPILDNDIGVTSTAHIVRVAACELTHSCTTNGAFAGVYYFFDATNPLNSLDNTYSNRRQATGIGDVVLRGKSTLITGEKWALAGGVDLRLPTGDELNFLGSGATGVKPFVAASYRARISPHVNIGYEWNGDSILEGDVSSGQKGRLPNQFSYSGGIDVRIKPRLTMALDLLGQRVIGGDRIKEVPFTDVQGTVHTDITTIQPFKASFQMDDLSVGAKYRLYRNLLLTGNVLFKLDDAGLRAKVVPLGGLSYTF
jgi:hypothetical protein